MHFEQHIGLRNQKYYTPMGGGGAKKGGCTFFKGIERKKKMKG